MNRNHLGRRRRIALLATSVLTVGTLAACATTPSTPDEPVDLTVAVWTANEAHLEIFNAIGDAYVEANPESVASVTFDTIQIGRAHV